MFLSFYRLYFISTFSGLKSVQHTLFINLSGNFLQEHQVCPLTKANKNLLVLIQSVPIVVPSNKIVIIDELET